MGNTNIDSKLKKKIKQWLEESENRLLIPNEKAFIHRACIELLNKLKRQQKRDSK